MEAKTFINKKHEDALEQLRFIEADYKIKRDAANAEIALTKKWLDELGTEKAAPEPELSLSDLTKSASSNWVSARDLSPQPRSNSH